jgi:hypothetical protein
LGLVTHTYSHGQPSTRAGSARTFDLRIAPSTHPTTLHNRATARDNRMHHTKWADTERDLRIAPSTHPTTLHNRATARDSQMHHTKWADTERDLRIAPYTHPTTLHNRATARESNAPHKVGRYRASLRITPGLLAHLEGKSLNGHGLPTRQTNRIIFLGSSCLLPAVTFLTFAQF